MAPLSATTLVYREKDIYKDISVYVTSVSLQIPVKNSTANAQKYTSLTMSALRKRNPDIQLLTVDGIPVPNDSTIPKGKEEFDCFFQTEVKRSSTENKAILIFFTIKSKQAFSRIKHNIYDYLQKQQMWLGRSPGPTQLTSLVPIGILTHIPPEASLNSVLLDVKMTVAANSTDDLLEHNSTKSNKAKTTSTKTMETDEDDDSSTNNNNSNTKFLASKTLDVHLQRQQTTARIPICQDRNITGHKIIADNFSTMVYSERKSMVLNMQLLEAYSKNMLHNMKYVPLSLQKSDPMIFGYLLNESITSVQKIRNAAICGISPHLMDSFLDNTQTVLDRIAEIEGVLRVDPRQRTVDLGKWNVAILSDNYDKACTKIDEIIQNIIDMTPPAMTSSTFREFPVPQRLFSRINNNINNTKPPEISIRDKYCKWLVQTCDNLIPIIEQPLPQRTVNIDSISYLQAAKKTIPPPSSTSKDSNTSKISPLTQPSIQELIDASIQKQEEKMDFQLKTIESKMEMMKKNIEDFKQESISQIVNSLIEREPFVTQTKFAQFEQDIKLILQGLPTIGNIQQLFNTKDTPPSPPLPICKYRKLDDTPMQLPSTTYPQNKVITPSLTMNTSQLE